MIPRQTAAWLLALAAALATGCTGESDRIERLRTGALVALDHGAPRHRFEGAGGSLQLESGFLPTSDRREDWIVSWVAGGRADASFLGAPHPVPVDFRAIVRPYSPDGAPLQHLEVWLNGRRAGESVIEPGWQELRIPLRILPEPGPNRLELHFAHAHRPRDFVKSTDHRRLSALFRELGVLPRAVEDAERYYASATFDGETRRLTLPVHGSAAIPVPASRTVSLGLAVAASACPDCELSIDVLRNGETRPLWRGEPESGSAVRVDLEDPDGAVGLLSFTLRAERAPPDAHVVLELPESWRTRSARKSRREIARPPVFLYVVDTLRADALEPYGAAAGTSPQIQRFANEAVTYSNPWAASSWTLPSTVSILSGVYPSRHGIMNGGLKLSRGGVPTLASLLSQEGYFALGISHSYVASDRFGLDRGFARFHLRDHLNGVAQGAAEIHRRLLHSLVEHGARARPLFTYIHGVEPHAPYRPRGADRRLADATPGGLPADQYEPKLMMRDPANVAAADVEHLRALYLGEVLHVDREFGRFLDLLRQVGLHDDAIIVLTSDHGEEFREHGAFNHGRTVFEEMLRVPLVIRYPGGRWGGRRVETRVNGVDIAPTILRAVGVGADALELDGAPLQLDAIERTPERTIASEVAPTGRGGVPVVDFRAFARGPLKCIHSANQLDQFGRPIPALVAFDLSRDPGEEDPLPEDDPGILRCRELLAAQLERVARGAEALGVESTDPDVLERLKALGYVE